LSVETQAVTDVPDFWHDTEMLLDYVDALTLSGKTLLDRNSQDLVGLLHDLIYVLVDQLKTPFITHA
jgi:hypothetical protein